MLRSVLTRVTSIVEYATRDQAQQAVAQLSNQNLMGRLVYVREVSCRSLMRGITRLTRVQDREAEPRFIGSSGGGRGGGFAGGPGPMHAGPGMQGGFAPGFAGGAPGGGGRQIYVANASSPPGQGSGTSLY
jgi:RNA recognition motif-containing protein